MALMNTIVLAVSEAGRERQMGLEVFRTAEQMREKVAEACFFIPTRPSGVFLQDVIMQSAARAAQG